MTKILAIETSCDETACAIVEDGRKVLASSIYSQIDIHEIYGGVVPEIASRKHIEKIDYVLESALSEAKLTFDDIDAIAVTSGPGLVGALLVGVSYAKGLAYALDKKLIPVHHIEGHIASNYIQNQTLVPPFLCLVISGGHSHIVNVRDFTDFEIIGRTRDDAAGEAFDKVARVLGLGYPGGPKLEKLARAGDNKSIKFPISKIEGYDYSFSGIKSSVLNYLNEKAMKNEKVIKENVAASFQEAVAKALIDKLILAAKDYGINRVAIAGGVSANKYIKEKLRNETMKNGLEMIEPSIKYCTDNAAMIGASAYYNYLKCEYAELDLNAVAHIEIGCHKFD